jgi:hypothetical protein
MTFQSVCRRCEMSQTGYSREAKLPSGDALVSENAVPETIKVDGGSSEDLAHGTC